MRSKVIIIFIFVLAVVLRSHDIETKNMWFDEVYSWNISQGTVVEIVEQTSGDIHPPLFYFILKYWISLFSDSIVSMRALSVVLGMLSMLVLFFLSKLILKNDLQIILVLLLYAVSPLNIYYSQEVRMPILNLLLCLCSVYFFYKFTETKKISLLFPYIFFTILSLYTHYFAFLILLTEVATAMIIFFFVNKNKKYILSYACAFIVINAAYLPWYPVMIGQTSKGQAWRTEQSLMQVLEGVVGFFKDIFISSYYGFEPGSVYYFAVFVSFFVAAFLLLSLFRLLNSKKFFSEENNTIIYFFFLPLLGSSLISMSQSIVLSRYLSIILPYLFITITYFSFRLYSRRIAIIVISFLIFSSAFGTYIYYNNGFKQNDYRKIISFIQNNYNKGDEIIVEPHFMGWSFKYYLDHNPSLMKKPEVYGWDLNMQVDSLRKLNSGKNIWFVLDYSSLEKNNYDSLNSYMNDMGYKRLQQKSFYIIPSKVTVSYYTKNKDLIGE